MAGPRCKVPRAEILAAFHTDETFKGCASRIGMSPNTLRRVWKEAFGEDAYKERGKQLQATAAAKTCREAATTRKYKTVEVGCSRCHSLVALSTRQTSQMADVAAYVCERCKDLEGDRQCPVCGQWVDGVRGLSGHFRWTQDEAHVAYQRAQEASKWAGRVEGLEYAVCRVCGHHALSLTRHIGAAHDLTAAEYHERYPGAVLRPTVTQEIISEKCAQHQAENGTGKGDQKLVHCPGCGKFVVVSKFLSEDVHDPRCEDCRAQDEDALWEGLQEPDDYVTCRVCGYRARNLTSHLQNAHPELVGCYQDKFPGTYINSLKSGSRIGGSPQALNLTKKDLEPHMASLMVRPALRLVVRRWRAFMWGLLVEAGAAVFCQGVVAGGFYQLPAQILFCRFP